MSETPQLPLVRITDPHHPHYPEHGRLTGKIISVLGKQMAEVAIDNCKHGASGCFAEAHQLGRLSEPMR